MIVYSTRPREGRTGIKDLRCSSEADFTVHKSEHSNRAAGRGHRPPAKRRRDGLYERCGAEGQMGNWPGSLPEGRSVNTSGAQVVWGRRISATTQAEALTANG